MIWDDNDDCSVWDILCVAISGCLLFFVTIVVDVSTGDFLLQKRGVGFPISDLWTPVRYLQRPVIICIFEEKQIEIIYSNEQQYVHHFCEDSNRGGSSRKENCHNIRFRFTHPGTDELIICFIVLLLWHCHHHGMMLMMLMMVAPSLSYRNPS